MTSFAAPTVAVMGAGAVGCYYGGMLAAAGVPVTLIGRAAARRRDAARRPRDRARGPPRRRPRERQHRSAAVRTADVVLVCVKSPDTNDAAARHRAILARGRRGRQPAERRRECAVDRRCGRPGGARRGGLGGRVHERARHRPPRRARRPACSASHARPCDRPGARLARATRWPRCSSAPAWRARWSPTSTRHCGPSSSSTARSTPSRRWAARATAAWRATPGDAR